MWKVLSNVAAILICYQEVSHSPSDIIFQEARKVSLSFFKWAGRGLTNLIRIKKRTPEFSYLQITFNTEKESHVPRNERLSDAFKGR